MRQIVSLVKDNQAHYALVDDEDGSLIPFADLLIPDPDRFGLTESALLGTNLITALGLNGTKRPRAQTISLANVPPTHREVPDPVELPPAPAHETARQRRNRIAREAYHRKHGGEASRGRGIPVDRSQTKAQRYVPIEEVMAIVNEHPQGIRVRDVAERIWRTTDGRGSDKDMPGWVYTAVSNRLTHARLDLRDKNIPLPFREEDRPVADKNGEFMGGTGKFLLPLPPD